MKDYYDDEEQSKEETEYEIRENHAKKVSARLLTIIQIMVCSMIVVTVIFLRFSGGNAYAVVKGWYLSHISQTIVPDEQIKNVKNRVIELFPAVSSQVSTNSQISSSTQSIAGSQKTSNSQSNTSSQPSTNSQQASDSQKLIG